VIATTASARGTGLTGTIDLSNDSPTGKSSRPRNPDKFVPRNSAKSHVALTQLHVRFTDSCLQNIDSNLARLYGAQHGVASKMQLAVKHHSSHDSLQDKRQKSQTRIFPDSPVCIKPAFIPRTALNEFRALWYVPEQTPRFR
jgi:hypothetical protein